MSEGKLQPIEAARLANRGDDRYQDQINEVIVYGSARDLQEFIHNIATHDRSYWFQRAKVALEIRLSEDAAKTAKELIEHTEKLTKQTDVLINESKSLTRYTKYLLG